MNKQTPVADGFVMPPEWAPHAGCYISWPYREDLWMGYLKKVQKSYAEVAKIINRFEPVTVLTPPSAVSEAHVYLGSDIEIFEVDLNDSWVRDNGPIFVTSGSGEEAIVDFEFNGWGNRFSPHDKDNALPATLAKALGVRYYKAPMVLEGGAISVDGQGTLLTTESCLLNPNRNPHLSREEIEKILADYLGIRKVIWLGRGLHDSVTDGHVDGVACFVRPGVVLAASTNDQSDPNYLALKDNLEKLRSTTDARGKSIEVIEIPLPKRRNFEGKRIVASYINFYAPNGGIVAPVYDDPNDEVALAILREVFPEREVVGVNCLYIGLGGGGIHCITQQRPMIRTVDNFEGNS